MTSPKKLTVTLMIILGIFTINTHARTWDLAIVAGQQIDFLARNGSLIGHAALEEAESLLGVAYDDITRTMYFSDVNNENISIFSNDLTDQNFTMNLLYRISSEQDESNIIGLAFDTSTRTLFWSDKKQGVIMKMQIPLNEPPGEPTILHNLTNLSPRGIALDICNRHIYWVNSNTSVSSIERSRLDGSDRITVVGKNLHKPIAVAIDHVEEKLYWIDDIEGIRIKVERSDFDGTNREMLINPKRHEPVYLAVDHDSIYWSDMVHKIVWTVPKNTKASDIPPMTFRSYESYSHYDAHPAGILARDNVGRLDCKAIRQNHSLGKLQQIKSYINLTTSTEDSELEPGSITETSKYCLNDGHVDRDGSCRCKSGYTGDYCETDLCHNYCFGGNCSINDSGLPTCKCIDTFVGPRCETNLCKDYCLHDGQCSVQNKKPVCKCNYSEGSRCEILTNTTELCKKYCANNETVPTSIAANCRCFAESEEVARVATFEEENPKPSMLLLIFGVFVALLVLVIAVLSYYVNKFRRRPRVKKRFVVSKGGVTALTSRPQLPDSQCEITIENCCNMNICETPCFEPKLRTPAPEIKLKKEEKNFLLDNMEEMTW